MPKALSRRDLILRGAYAGALLSLPGSEALAAVRKRGPRRSVHCLPAQDRFDPRSIIGDCSFSSFAPDSQRFALVTSRGIELLDRRDGSRVALTRPGFTLAGGAWHPDGTVFIASGPADDGSGPFLHLVDPAAGSVTRLLPDHPGQARAAVFSPDGTKVAFTYLNQYVHQLALADWSGGALQSPTNLIPYDPASEQLLDKFQAGLAWYETRGFSPDGQRLYFASDRGSGMLNVSVHYIELATGRRRRVTRDHGVVEGAAITPDDSTLIFSSTRARESGYMTMVTGPTIPPVLGFVAEPTLHRTLAERLLAPIGNGDVLAVDESYGLEARMVGKREKVVGKLGTELVGWLHRLVVCGISADGRELAVAVSSTEGRNVILLRRKRRSVPPPAVAAPTPVSKGSLPLRVEPFPDLSRIFESDFGGRVSLELAGSVDDGSFSAEFDGFNSDGTKVYAGSMDFQTAAGGFRHSSDVARVNFDETEEATTYYRADMRVDWEGATDGTFDSRSRHGVTSAAWDGSTFANVAPWRAGKRRPEPIPGAKNCPDTGRT